MAFSICASKTRIFASEGTKQGRNNHWMKVLGLERPGVHGGARAGIALLPTSRGPRSRVTLAFLWGRGAALFAGRKRLQPQHTRRVGRSNQSGQSRLCRTASEFVKAGEAIAERRSPNKENVTVTTSWIGLLWCHATVPENRK